LPAELDSYALMRAVLLAETALLALGTLVLIFAGGSSQRTIRQQRDRRRVVTAALSHHFDGGPAGPALSALEMLKPDERAVFLVEIARTLQGTQFNMLRVLADSLGILNQAERECADRRWWRRLRAVRLLSGVGGGERVLPRMFDDPEPLVRAQVAEWASGTPTRRRIDRLCEMLNDPVKLCRHTAADSLLRIGAPAVPVLLEHLQKSSGESALFALRVAVDLSDARFLPAAQRLADSPSAEVRRAVARLLGRLGGDESSLRLMSMLDDEDPEVRAAACAALGALGYWPAAARIAQQLHHPAWIVRRTAAVSLRRIGSTGMLLLRHALNDADAFAADAARQVLELPEIAAYE
jgi:hypothetical protein